MYRMSAIITIVAGHILIVYYAWQGFAGPWSWPALALGILAGHLLLDLVTLMVHWTLDNYFSPSTPLIGTVIGFFREHHVNEAVMFERDYFEGNFENALLGAGVLALLLPFSFSPWACFMLSFAAFGSMYITQIHKWSHQPSPPWPVRLLQRSYLLIDKSFHDGHHRDTRYNYGLYAGWLDRLFNRLYVLEALEVVLFVLTGAVAVESRLKLASPEEHLGIGQRWRRAFWRLWYGFLASYARRKGAQFTCMNWGYADDGEPSSPTLQEHPERYPLQLYDALYGDAGRPRTSDPERAGPESEAPDVIVDMSCGRGGGIAYLYEQYQPGRAIGIDLVPGNIEACRRSFGALQASTDPDDAAVQAGKGLCYRQGSAEALPLDDGAADIVLSVEASHCYGDLSRFLAEAHRVLKPGGFLLWTDFAPSDQQQRRRELASRWFTIVEERDITAQVLRAMRLDASRRIELIQAHAAPWLHNLLAHFAAAGEEQRSYQDFAEGRDHYFLLRLRRPIETTAAQEPSTETVAQPTSINLTPSPTATPTASLR